MQPDPLQCDYGKIPAQYGSPGAAHGLARGADHVSRDPESGRLPYRGSRQVAPGHIRQECVREDRRQFPFPRCKTRLCDSGIKTPFVVRWPDGFVKPGRVCNSLVSVIDVAPTILKLAGLKPPPSFQGSVWLHC